MALKFYRGIFMISLSLSSSFAQQKGFFVKNHHLKSNFIISKKTLSISNLSRYIRQTNPSRSSDYMDNEQMAETILRISSCLEIDPYIFTALIRKESSFRTHAKSPTGAVGLTQFTTLGLNEVNDQLGAKGRAGAPVANTEYWLNLMTECVDYDFQALYHQNETIRAQKSVIMNQPKYALYYGSILLKTYLAHQKRKIENGTLHDIYRKALEQYNGEVTPRRQSYAAKILKYAHLLERKQK